MTMKLAVLVFALAALSGCGTKNYTPNEYPITNDRIQDFKSNGKITVENQQTDTTKLVVLAANNGDYVADNKLITEHLASQLKKEIAIHGTIINSNLNKSIGLKVISQNAYVHIFYMSGKLEVMVSLGESTPFSILVENGNPLNALRVLNGNIALAVIQILSDKRVLDYLAE